MKLIETLSDAIRKWGSLEPERIAITFLEGKTEKKISAGELLQRATKYAHFYKTESVTAGDLIIIVLQHSEELIYAFWGAALLGAIPSIFPFMTEKLDPHLYQERVKMLVKHSEAKVVITYPEFHTELAELLKSAKSTVLSINDLEETKKDSPYGPQKIPSENIALLQHSSGTTGLQKGVALSHSAVLAHIISYGRAIELNHEKDVVVSWLPLYHDMGLIAGFVMPIVTGTHLVLMSPFDWVRRPQILLETISKYKGTISWLPNFAFNHIARTFRQPNKDEIDLSSWRAVINCSEPVYDESHRAFLLRLSPLGFPDRGIATCYAMAENTFAVTQSVVGEAPNVDQVELGAIQEKGLAIPTKDGERRQFVSCGKAIDGVELAILNSDGKPLEDRNVGEIALRSNFMLTGYYKRPDLDEAAVTEEGWYLTGDIGYIADGDLYISGRKKDLIIVGGKNIYPQDLEEIVNRIDGIYPGRAVAFGIYDQRLGSEQVVMVCETTDEGSGNLIDMEAKLRSQVVLESEITLSDLRFVERGWVIKTSSGKLGRNDNREKYLKEFL